MRVLILLLLCVPILAEDWPEFRGPTGQGVSVEHGLPLTWSETKNVKWKVAIPGKGWSSPAILGDRIWLTTATEEGKSLRAICVDRNTGAITQNIEVFRLKRSEERRVGKECRSWWLESLCGSWNRCVQ